MKLIANVSIRIKKGVLPQFIQSLYKYACSPNMINLTDSDDKWEEYHIEISHSNRKDLARLIDFLKKNNEFFRDIAITATIEDKIKGGLLVTCGKDNIDSVNDLQTSLIGGAILINEKIDSGMAQQFCGIFNSVALISGHKIKKDFSEAEIHHQYTDSERDAIIINRFTGKNAFPLIIKYHAIEDMIKTIMAIESNFACIRLMNHDDDDILLNSINDSISIPLISRDNDELPLYYLSLIKKIARNNRLKLEQTSVGIIGLTRSSIRLTSLLNKSGFMKVLGYDNKEKMMMSFENEKGLATTIQNILMNTDIIIIMNDIIRLEDMEYFRPGQFIISYTANEYLNQEALRTGGIKEFIKLEDTDTALLYPGMIKGIIHSGVKVLNNEMIIRMSEMILKMMDDSYTLHDIFSDIHERIEGLITKN